MEVGKFLFELVVTLLLVGYVVFPVHQFQVGSFNAFLQLFGSLNGGFDLYVRLLLLHLLLQSCQLGL